MGVEVLHTSFSAELYSYGFAVLHFAVRGAFVDDEVKSALGLEAIL